MRKAWPLLCLLIGLIVLKCPVSAQVNPSLVPVLGRTIQFQPSAVSNDIRFQFPRHIQQNPMGYSPLCRVELKIEKQLPVGVWMRADGNPSRGVTNPGLAYLRFRIPLGN